MQHNISVWFWKEKCMPRVSSGFCRRRIPSINKSGKRLTSRTLESVRAQWQTVGWPRHRDPCHHLHMRCPLFSLTCQTLSSCAQSICILLRSADCNWFPTMLPRHTHSTRPAALSYGGAREVAGPSVVVVSWEVVVLLHYILQKWTSSPKKEPVDSESMKFWLITPHRRVKDIYNLALFLIRAHLKVRQLLSEGSIIPYRAVVSLQPKPFKGNIHPVQLSSI